MILKDRIQRTFNLYKHNFINLDTPKVSNNVIHYNIDTSENLNEFFIQKTSFIEYLAIDKSLKEVPEGLLIIPFLCNILPVFWMFDATIVINELDKTFYESIARIKKNILFYIQNVILKGNY